MSDLEQIGLASLFGVILGVIFFGGLLWTIQRGLHSQQPALTFVVSYFIRLFAVMLGFWWMASSHWGSIFACLCAFVAVRFLFTRFGRLLQNWQTRPAGGGDGHKTDLSSAVVTTTGSSRSFILAFAGTSHIAAASFAKASRKKIYPYCQ